MAGCIKCGWMRILKVVADLAAAEVKDMNNPLHSGDICPRTGAYKVINEDGKTLNTVFVGEGETMPPTQHSSCYYEFAD